MSLPIGARDVTVIDMATAYSAFANGGKRVQPYAAVDIKDGHGDLVYRHDRDGPQPKQVAPASDVATLNTMLAKVVTDGTGRAARLDDAVAVGKTGTTNEYRNAWFCGFTGDYVAAVWYGNDDYSPMDKVTGGTLPASTWHDIMEFAQAGIAPRPPFGLGQAGPAVASTAPVAGGTQPAGNNRSTLTPRAASALGAIAALVADAGRPRLAGGDAYASEAPGPTKRSNASFDTPSSMGRASTCSSLRSSLAAPARIPSRGSRGMSGRLRSTGRGGARATEADGGGVTRASGAGGEPHEKRNARRTRERRMAGP